MGQDQNEGGMGGGALRSRTGSNRLAGGARMMWKGQGQGVRKKKSRHLGSGPDSAAPDHQFVPEIPPLTRHQSANCTLFHNLFFAIYLPSIQGTTLYTHLGDFWEGATLQLPNHCLAPRQQGFHCQ